MNKRHLNLFIAFLVFAVSVAASGAYYDERPDITQVKPVADSKVDFWKVSAHGQFLFIAQTLAFFPTSEYYFLARDIEYGYDIAKLMAKDDPVLRQRLHLVPVSTALSQQKGYLVDYLEQEGVTKERLQNRTALFIDSCCTGSVPTRIEEAFRNKGVKIQGFLIQTAEYPGSLTAAYAGADGAGIEELPHYTQTGNRYAKAGNKLRIGADRAPESARTKALAIMGQIRHEFDKPQKRAEFLEIVGLMRRVYSYAVENSGYKQVTRQQAEQALTILASKHDVPAAQFLEDIQSMGRRNYARPSKQRIKQLEGIAKDLNKRISEAFIRKVVLWPKSIESMSQDSKWNAGDIILEALELLLKSKPKDLGISEQKRIELLKEWTKVYADTVYLVDNRFEIYLKALVASHSGARALENAYSYMQDVLSDVDAKQFSKLAIHVLEKEKYVYKKDSALHFLVNKFDWDHVSEAFKPVMLNVIENADDRLLEKLSVDLFRAIPEAQYWSEKSHELYREVSQVVKALVDALPTISKPMIIAYMKSKMVFGDDKPYKEFAHWLFSQREYFEADALRVEVPYGARELLSKGKIKNRDFTRVENIVDVHAGPVAPPPGSLNRLRGKSCSRVFSGK